VFALNEAEGAGMLISIGGKLLPPEAKTPEAKSSEAEPRKLRGISNLPSAQSPAFPLNPNFAPFVGMWMRYSFACNNIVVAQYPGRSVDPGHSASHPKGEPQL
jgi:hypothetical protein